MAASHIFVFGIFIFLLFLRHILTAQVCYRGCVCKKNTITCNLTFQTKLPRLYTRSNLTDLKIYGSGKVTEIPANEFAMSSFAKIEMFNTGLHDLPCSLFYALEKTLRLLTFDGHLFKRIPRCTIADLGSMQFLKLSNGLIQNLISGDFTGQPKMKVLDLSYNQIQDINIRAINDMPYLERLVLKGNKLVTLKPRQFNEIRPLALQLLDLSHNMIEAISQELFEGFGTNLHGLDISFNRITKKTWPSVIQSFPAFPYLCLLNVSGNSLVSVDGKSLLDYFSHLHTLGMSECSLGTVDWVGFRTVGYLDVSKNNQSLQELTIISENNTLSDCDRSEIKVNVSHGSLKTLHLTRRYGSYNKKAVVVSAEQNQLTNVELSLLNIYPWKEGVVHPDIELFLGNNFLETGVLFNTHGVNPDLYQSYHFHIWLHLNDNHFKNGLDEPIVVNRQFRNISSLEKIPYCNFTSNSIVIELLDLSGNGITHLPDDLCLIKHVVILIINRNSIQQLDFSRNDLYYGLIREIHARENKLTSLPKNSFQDLYNLERIDLRDNQLTGLPDMSYLNSLSNMELLQLDGNPLFCDCTLAKLAEVYQLFPEDSVLELKTTGRCFGPKEFENFNPMCFSFGALSCSTLSVSAQELERLWRGCDEDKFSVIKDVSVTVESYDRLNIAWRKVGPGRIDGYLISFHDSRIKRQSLFIPSHVTNTTIENLSAGETIAICIALIVTTTTYGETDERKYCQTVTLDNISSQTVMGLAIALGVLGIVLVAFILFHVLRRSNNAKPNDNDYDTAEDHNYGHGISAPVSLSASTRSYLVPIPPPQTVPGNTTASENNDSDVEYDIAT